MKRFVVYGRDMMRIMTALMAMAVGCSAAMAQDNTALDRLITQMEIYPQEKIHVVTDREMYCAGDTMWLRTFVVDALTLQNAGLSKYAYLELRNPFKEVVSRIKLIDRDGVFSGYIPLTQDMPEGDYTLTAYTVFSENQGSDYFFRKPVRILAPYSAKYAIDSEFTPAGSGEVKGNFKLRALGDDEMYYQSMSWTMPDGKTLEFADSPKGFSRKFRRDKGEEVVLVKFGDYARFVPVAYPTGTTAMRFYPEGGWLIAGQPCDVAFKATDEDGRGVSASGVVRDDAGTEITRFSTSHNGMGKVSFIPEEGRIYSAEYIGPDGEMRNAEIGAPRPGAASLRYGSSRARSVFSVAGGDGMDLELVVALRGKGILATPISADRPISIDKATLPTGLYQAMLVSRGDSVVVSERIFFIGADWPAPEVAYIPNDSLKITLQLPAGGEADCCVRIFNHYNGENSQTLNARTQMLLQSELRGRIEDPTYYFNTDDREADRNLDLLMMVNGWSRYNLPEALTGRYTEPSIPLEIGQEISGRVKSRWRNKPLEGVMVYAIAPKADFGTFAETDANGEFHLDGFDLPEGTPFIFRAMNEDGGNEGNYEVDDMKYPSSETLPGKTTDNGSEAEISDFFKGRPWIMLDEIKVQAFAQKEVDIYEMLASHSKSTEDFKRKAITTIEEAVRDIPGTTIIDGSLFWRGSPVAYYIDGVRHTAAASPNEFKVNRASLVKPAFKKDGGNVMPTPVKKPRGGTPLADIIRVVPFDAIERIDFLRRGEALILDNLDGGALMITTKDGTSRGIKTQFELKDHVPLGYQKYKEYASPMLSAAADAYDLESASTLLWLPSVKFSGNATDIDLKMPLRPEYEVIIEGISDSGPIYQRN